MVIPAFSKKIKDGFINGSLLLATVSTTQTVYVPGHKVLRLFSCCFKLSHADSGCKKLKSCDLEQVFFSAGGTGVG